jgi:hypothetical protein
MEASFLVDEHDVGLDKVLADVHGAGVMSL